MVPDGWSSVRLEYHAEFITSGSRGWADYYADVGDIFVRITNLRRNSIAPDWSKTKHVSLPKGMNEGLRTRLKAGDILISITADLGIIGFIRDEPDVPHYINQHVALVRFNCSALVPEYVAYSLSSAEMRYAIQRLNDAGAKAALSLQTIRSIPLHLPPLPEQRKIAAILSTWDRAIEKTEALLANARTQKRALLQSLLTGKRRFPEFEGQPWKEVRLGELFAERSDRGGADLDLLAITSSRGVIPQAETDRRDISRDDKSSYKQVHVGDIAYNSMRMWQGVSALSSMMGLVSPAYTIVIPGPFIDARFAAHLFKLPKQVHQFRRFSQGLTSDTWNLKFKQFAEVPTSIPSIEEQQIIASFLDVVDDEIAGLAEHSSKLRTEKKALMQQLLTGKRRVVV